MTTEATQRVFGLEHIEQELDRLDELIPRSLPCTNAMLDHIDRRLDGLFGALMDYPPRRDMDGKMARLVNASASMRRELRKTTGRR